MKSDRIGVCGSGGFIGGPVAANLLRPGHRSLCGMDTVEDIASVNLKRTCNLNALKRADGRNSDDPPINQYFDWAPRVRLREGKQKAHDLIYGQIRPTGRGGGQPTS